MLNRNAEALFWVGRYMERAENHARLIDVHYHLEEGHAAQEARGDDGAPCKWSGIVDALGSRTDYEERYGSSYREAEVIRYVTLDRDHSNSLFACVSHARDNLRSLREKLPSELWDVVNGFYLWLRDPGNEAVLKQSPHRFFVRVKEWAALFQGMAQSVMPRENEWHFMGCGRYLERAENTLRILQVAHGRPSADWAERYSYLQAVLKSVSAYQVFRRYHSDSLRDDTVFEFLLLHGAFPRSVQYAMQTLTGHLKGLELQAPAVKSSHVKLVRQSGKIVAELSCLGREDLESGNETQILYQMTGSCGSLGTAFANVFFRFEEVGA